MFIKYTIILCCLQLVRPQMISDDQQLQDVGMDSGAATDPSNSSSFGFSEDSKDLLGDNLNWECANNASCVQNIADEVVNRLKQHRPLAFGGIEVEPLDNAVPSLEVTSQGRGLSFVDLLSQNSVKIPLGPMVVSVQKSIDHKDYLEVALLRKGDEQGEWCVSGGFQKLKVPIHMGKKHLCNGNLINCFTGNVCQTFVFPSFIHFLRSAPIADKIYSNSGLGFQRLTDLGAVCKCKLCAVLVQQMRRSESVYSSIR